MDDLPLPVCIWPCLLYQGHKSDPLTKISLVVTLVEHVGANCIEIIAHTTADLKDLHRVYVPASGLREMAAGSDLRTQLAAAVTAEYRKLKVDLPQPETVMKIIQNYSIASLVLANMTIQAKPLAIDVSNKGQLGAISRSAAHNNNNSEESKTASACINKPDSVIPAEVKRLKVNKEEEMLSKIVASLQPGLPSSSTPSRSNANHPQSHRKHRPADPPLRGFGRFRNDNDVLQASLSFLPVSDMMFFQAVCKRWKTVLSFALHCSSTLSIWNRTQDLFVLPETVLLAMRCCAKTLTDLRLHNVIIDLSIIGHLSCLSGKADKVVSWSCQD